VLFSKNKTKLIACPATMSTEYSIPNTVQTIEAGAFTNCTLLTGKIRIPASVINIGSYAFYGCSSISGFEVDENNQYFSSLDGLLFNRSQDSLYICPLSKSGKYEVPNTVSYIGYSAFDGCTSLSEIVVPASVKTIDNYAFEYCSGLLKVQIAENIDSIGTAAFYYCTNLNTFEIKQPIPPAIDYYTFDGVDQSTCSLVVPTGSATIYQSAKFWKDFTNLSESDFANNIANIDYSKLKISCNNKHVTVSEITIGEKLSLYDIQGKKIFEITPKQNTIMFNLTHNGIYILKTKSASYKLSI
jgi:hypothetical protein